MSDFTYDNLPSVSTKSDARAPVTPAQEIDAADVNQLSTQDVSMRSALIAGQYHGLATQGSTPPVSPPGQVRTASINDQLYKSENGGGWALAMKPDLVTASASGGTVTPAVKQETIIQLTLDANLTIADPVLSGAAIIANGGAGTRLALVLTQDSTGYRQLTFSGTKFKDVASKMPRQGPGQRTVFTFFLAADGTWTLGGTTAIDLGKPLDTRDWGAVADGVTDSTQALQNLFLFLSDVPAWQASHTYYSGKVITNAGNAYLCTNTAGTSGVSAGSGGPTGTGASTTDGGLTWKYLGYAGATIVGGRTNAVFLPNGITCHKEGLQYIGNPGQGFNLLGVEGAARGGQQGSCLAYIGASGGNGLHLRGANGCRIKDVEFYGGMLAKRPVWLSEYYPGPTVYDSSFQIGSSGVFFESCYFNGNGPTTDSVGCYVGPDNGVTSNLQCSEVRFDKCTFGGRGDIIGLAGVHIASPSNTKNFTFNLCIFNYWDFGIYQPAGSGVTLVNDCQFGLIGYNQDGTAIYMGSGNALVVTNFQMENGGIGPDGLTAFRARVLFTANGLSCTVTNGYLAGTLPADDIAMQAGGPLSVIGFSFEANSRAGSNICKVAGNQLFVAGCDWAWNTTAIQWAPLYDNGGSNAFTSSDVYRFNATLPGRCTAVANKAGLVGTTHATFLRDFSLDRPDVVRGSFGVDPANGYQSTGISYVAEDGRFYIIADYTAFQTGALSKQLIATAHPGDGFLRHATVKVLVPFAGVAGPLAFMVGHQIQKNSGGATVDASLIASCDPTAAAGTRYGKTDAEMGSSLTVAGRASAEGLYLDTAGGGTAIKLKMVSSSGNLSGLNAGKVAICLLYDYVGSGV